MSDETTTADGTVTEETERDAARAAHRRRTVIRLLVGLGIGIPVLVELATFVGLVEQSLLGGTDEAEPDGADGTDGSDDTDSTDEAVGVGDELLPATEQTETLTVASFRAGADSWVLTLVASVENIGTEPYVVQFGTVTTESGRRVEGAGRAVTVAPGEMAQVTGTWQLPPGNRPASVVVRTGTDPDDLTAHEVELARIPVEGN